MSASSGGKKLLITRQRHLVDIAREFILEEMSADTNTMLKHEKEKSKIYHTINKMWH